jgi:hypothetical protein
VTGDPSVSQRVALLLEERPMTADAIFEGLKHPQFAYGPNQDLHTSLAEVHRILYRRSDLFVQTEDGSWRVRT